MVVLSVSICNKKGKIFLARQYVPMSRLRIESILTVFPTLIDSDERNCSKQYTYIEANDVRYLFQTINDMYLLLVTNLQSNILNDTETLKMIRTLTPQFCGGFTKENLTSDRIIDLIPVLDEIVAPMGYKQNVTKEQVKEFVEMDSFSEKAFEKKQQEIIKQQMNAIQEKANELDKQRKQSNHQKWNNTQIYTSSSINPHYTQQSEKEYVEIKENIKPTDPVPIKKMILRGKKEPKIYSEVKEFYKENTIENVGFGFSDHELSNNDTSNMNPIEILISEKLCVTFDRDGTMKKFQIKGDLQVIINDPNAAQCAIQTNITPNTTCDFGKCVWRLHPRMNSKEWKRGMLSFKDKNNKFKMGTSKVLEWILTAKHDDYVPIAFSFWPEVETDDKMLISAQYTANTAMRNVVVTFPASSKKEADIKQIENGNFVLNRNNRQYEWILNDLDIGDEGTVEYMIKETDIENLYPISISFQVQNSYANIGVTSIHDIDDEQKYEYATKAIYVAQKYVIE